MEKTANLFLSNLMHALKHLFSEEQTVIQLILQVIVEQSVPLLIKGSF